LDLIVLKQLAIAVLDLAKVKPCVDTVLMNSAFAPFAVKKEHSKKTSNLISQIGRSLLVILVS
jgi:hypothetical protein